MLRLLVCKLAAAALVFVAPLGAPAETYRGAYPIRVVATIGMVADIARNVGGDYVRVEQMLGAGVDPHLYKPTRDDVASVLRADLILANGLMLEGKLARTLARVARRKPVLMVAESVDPQRLIATENGATDPHLWMDASLWAECTTAVAETLSEFDPPHAADYRAAAARYRGQLDRLHEYGKRSLASVPAERRILVTSHDAFSYFGRAYGLTVEGVQGISTESEAGLRRVNGLVKMLVDRKLPAVFVESSVSRKSVEALVEGARARGHRLAMGGELFSDAMGKAGAYEGTYIGMLDHNITRATRALGGEAPERGLNGRLAPPAG